MVDANEHKLTFDAVIGPVSKVELVVEDLPRVPVALSHLSRTNLRHIDRLGHVDDAAHAVIVEVHVAGDIGWSDASVEF